MIDDPAELGTIEWAWYWSKRITPWVAGILMIGAALAGAMWLVIAAVTSALALAP